MRLAHLRHFATAHDNKCKRGRNLRSDPVSYSIVFMRLAHATPLNEVHDAEQYDCSDYGNNQASD